MSDLIHLLPEGLTHQIAAGEVVQRPASALKELIENSLDAGATHIEILIREAGKEAIHVIDDGEGMSTVDARMCFAQHATSKIRNNEDLQRISTFGFRGEALSSMAAVSQMELKTRRAEDETGTSILVEKSQILRQSHVQTPKGSQFIMRNLFFNVPARRKFLRSATTEMRYLVQVFQQAALSQPKIAFTLHTESGKTSRKTLYRLATATLQVRIAALLGKAYTKKILPVQAQHPALRIHGYIGKPEAASKKGGEQWIFVNTRYIRSRYLNKAITQAYESLITPDRYPFFLIFMDIDPLQLDVNIHPSKTEIKFEDEQIIYALLQAAIKKALSNHHISTKIDFSLDTNFVQHMRHTGKKEGIKASLAAHKWQTLQQAAALESQYKFGAAPATASEDEAPSKPILDATSSTSDTVKQEKVEAPSSPTSAPSTSTSSRVQKEVVPNFLEVSSTEAIRSSYPFFTLQGRYICKPSAGHLLIMDSQRAQERVMYERFAAERTSEGPTQRLMFAEAVPFSVADIALFKAGHALLRAAGFLYKIKAEGLEIEGLPAGLPTTDTASLFETLLHALQQEYKPDIKGPQKAFWRLTAAHLAARQPTLRTAEEIKALVEALYACEQPNYTPTGAPISRYLKEEDLQKLLK